MVSYIILSVGILLVALIIYILFNKSYLSKLMDDDVARKINEMKIPSDKEDEIEEYDNCVMEIKNQSVRILIIE